MEMIYLDTNAFYFYFFVDTIHSPSIKKIFEKIEKGEENGLTNCLTLDELAYVVLLRSIEKKYKEVHPAKTLREKPEVMSEFLPKIKEMFGTIFSFSNLTIADTNKDLMAVIPQIMEKLLLPRDCIHYQTMKDFDCKKILSTDPDFDKLEDIIRIKPEEVK